ncbi:TdeIII family type II restriction endonuclease [Clostridium botulinum]|uniref:TdeIII family type II restriction endonuclease n=1 Tax=Clostridium botulinum TaxID=1491 RepID=UPI001966FA84|nr:TdeIII family type II restriction endonuclease [Clostridium botulinum]MBN1073251.1 TdeIII family type II restriction endonuclease [Clostridium botulinum]
MISIQTKMEIKKLITDTVLNKFNNFSLETEYKPFFQSMFSEKDIITGAVIQSLYTTFGMSIYEQIAIILAKSAGFHAEGHYKLHGEIDSVTENLIQDYWTNLKNGLKNKLSISSNKLEEIQMIRNSIKQGRELLDGDSIVDVYIRKPSGEEFFIDITTVKNNLKGFEVLKLKMLRWIGLKLSINVNATLNSFIAIPYNPYYPNAYIESRWNATILDGNNDILIQEEFWNFVGNDSNTFAELICIFQEVGQELQNEINHFFNNL